MRKLIQLAVLCLILLANLLYISAQDKQCKTTKTNVGFVSLPEKRNNQTDKITTFLHNSEELRGYSANGFTSVFSGNFRAIPDELQRELILAFPERRFYIAKMKVLIDPPYSNYDLILITNAFTSEVEGYVWANYWVISPSNSFEKVLDSHQATSKNEAISQAKTFAKLITFANDDKIGNATVKNEEVRVELIRGAGVFGILKVKLSENLQFDRLTITEPDGKELRYFVSQN